MRAISSSSWVRSKTKASRTGPIAPEVTRQSLADPRRFMQINMKRIHFRIMRQSALAAVLWLGLLTPAASAQADHPELVDSAVTDISLIEEISKFRSGAGHDFSYDPTFPFGSSDSTEPPSSMKHYFAPYSFYNGDQHSVPVYAPFAGEITRVTDESGSAGINKRVEIQSDTHPEYTLIVFHIKLGTRYPQILDDWPIEFWPSHQPDDSTYETRAVAAGDLLGYADMRDSHDFDIAVLFTDTDGERYWISYFDLMPDSLFSSYSSRGIARSDLSISKADRLLTPVDWWGGRNDDDWVSLTQAVPLDPWTSATALGTLSLLLLFFLKSDRLAKITVSGTDRGQSTNGAKRQTSLSTFR